MYLKINVERFCDKICKEKLFVFNQRPTRRLFQTETRCEFEVCN